VTTAPNPAEQPSLFDPPLAPIVPVGAREHEPLDAYFARWLAANPHVLDAFVHYAEQVRRRGLRRFGAKAIAERLRWEYAIQTEDDSGFKLNNNLTSRLARAAVDRRPDLAGLFEFRELRS
jgi:hypothetical protein